MKIKKISKVNPVAKYSRNKSGAGYHKDKTKYNRKNKMCGGYTGEHEETVAQKLDRLVLLERMQENCKSPSLWFSYEEEIIQIKEELQDVDF